VKTTKTDSGVIVINRGKKLFMVTWLRVLSNRPYDLFINGHRVNSENMGSMALDAGDWIIGTQRALDPADSPDLIDTDEEGSLEAGNQFLSPPIPTRRQMIFTRFRTRKTGLPIILTQALRVGRTQSLCGDRTRRCRSAFMRRIHGCPLH
jgi:hypothetical protein